MNFPDRGIYMRTPPLAYKFRRTGKFKCLQKTPNALENLIITSITIVNMSKGSQVAREFPGTDVHWKQLTGNFFSQ